MFNRENTFLVISEDKLKAKNVQELCVVHVCIVASGGFSHFSFLGASSSLRLRWSSGNDTAAVG